MQINAGIGLPGWQIETLGKYVFKYILINIIFIYIYNISKLITNILMDLRKAGKSADMAMNLFPFVILKKGGRRRME